MKIGSVSDANIYNNSLRLTLLTYAVTFAMT
jgi:hypothetical protein